jgi:hypothetical protein
MATTAIRDRRRTLRYRNLVVKQMVQMMNRVSGLIQCNSLGTNGYCNVWFIDPIPISNGDGTFSPGQAIGRLAAITTKGTGTYTNEGDFRPLLDE